MPHKKYAPGTVIKYSEQYGFQRKENYAIVVRHRWTHTLEVISELNVGEVSAVHLRSKQFPEAYSTIDEVLESYKKIPETVKDGISFSNERLYLRQIGEMLEKIRKASEKNQNNNYKDRGESIH